MNTLTLRKGLMASNVPQPVNLDAIAKIIGSLAGFAGLTIFLKWIAEWRREIFKDGGLLEEKYRVEIQRLEDRNNEREDRHRLENEQLVNRITTLENRLDLSEQHEMEWRKRYFDEVGAHRKTLEDLIRVGDEKSEMKTFALELKTTLERINHQEYDPMDQTK